MLAGERLRHSVWSTALQSPCRGFLKQSVSMLGGLKAHLCFRACFLLAIKALCSIFHICILIFYTFIIFCYLLVNINVTIGFLKIHIF